ncbi:hypothetical protein WR25_13093 isoform D [Diploscapter pachys]|uniref:HNH nuclease domain-containing protein n=1 Tax=Diploscapter pachys TaxID=2018661 RepID=A0A2A2KFA7_9BILA|nr:hypothetical protein WR25_13093 isoform D [Diploscapter pachys]
MQLLQALILLLTIHISSPLSSVKDKRWSNAFKMEDDPETTTDQLMRFIRYETPRTVENTIMAWLYYPDIGLVERVDKKWETEYGKMQWAGEFEASGKNGLFRKIDNDKYLTPFVEKDDIGRTTLAYTRLTNETVSLFSSENRAYIPRHTVIAMNDKLPCPGGAEIGHIIPASAGGSSREDNLFIENKELNQLYKHMEFNTKFFLNRAGRAVDHVFRWEYSDDRENESEKWMPTIFYISYRFWTEDGLAGELHLKAINRIGIVCAEQKAMRANGHTNEIHHHQAFATIFNMNSLPEYAWEVKKSFHHKEEKIRKYLEDPNFVIPRINKDRNGFYTPLKVYKPTDENEPPFFVGDILLENIGRIPRVFDEDVQNKLRMDVLTAKGDSLGHILPHCLWGASLKDNLFSQNLELNLLNCLEVRVCQKLSEFETEYNMAKKRLKFSTNMRLKFIYAPKYDERGVTGMTVAMSFHIPQKSQNDIELVYSFRNPKSVYYNDIVKLGEIRFNPLVEFPSKDMKTGLQNDPSYPIIIPDEKIDTGNVGKTGKFCPICGKLRGDRDTTINVLANHIRSHLATHDPQQFKSNVNGIYKCRRDPKNSWCFYTTNQPSSMKEHLIGQCSRDENIAKPNLNGCRHGWTLTAAEWKKIDDAQRNAMTDAGKNLAKWYVCLK